MANRALIVRWGTAIVAVAAVAGGVLLLFAGSGGAATGALTPLGCIDDNDQGTDPEQGEDNCADSVDGLHEPDAMVMSPDGRSFYSASEEDDAVARFRRALN